MKKFSNGVAGGGAKEDDAKREDGGEVIEGRIARATFKVLQVSRHEHLTLYSKHGTATITFQRCTLNARLQHFWISGDGTHVTLCNEKALGDGHVVVVLWMMRCGCSF